MRALHRAPDSLSSTSGYERAHNDFPAQKFIECALSLIMKTITTGEEVNVVTQDAADTYLHETLPCGYVRIAACTRLCVCVCVCVCAI